MRLDKFLADMGCGTRSDLKNRIRKGQAAVSTPAGLQIIKDPGFQVGEDTEVMLDGKPVRYLAKVYIMLNKPDGVITATEDKREQTVLDMIPAIRKDIFPVGRLDKDTEGLLLLTNDGELAHRLLSPKHHIDKEYYAVLDKPVSEREVRLFADGLDILDEEPFRCLPARLAAVSEGSADDENKAEVLVTIQEGKYHQVKRMFSQVGRQVLYLKRVSMGPLKLDEKLSPGQWRYLTDKEVEELKGILS